MVSVKKGIEAKQFYSFCHDFKTPLSTIVGITSMTLSELDDKEKVKDRLATIEAASHYLLAMVNDVLDYSVISSNKMFIRNKPFNVNKIIELLKQLHTPFFNKKQQLFKISKKKVYYDMLLGDSLRISQILTNLLTNSMKYTEIGGEILLEFVQRPKTEDSLIMEMRVTDNGIGMSQEFMKCMFEPYSMHTEGNGVNWESTGLGLFITERLVTLMGGKIHVESELRKGTSITVSIPFGIYENNPPDNVAAPAINQKNIDFYGKFFLIADDNEDLLDMTTEILVKAGAEVLPVQSGLLALEAFENSRESSIDVILLDLYMGTMSGLEAIKKIRRSVHPDSKKIPIIVLTASEDPVKCNAVKEAGANEIVRKPINYPLLFELLNGYTDSKK